MTASIFINRFGYVLLLVGIAALPLATWYGVPLSTIKSLTLMVFAGCVLISLGVALLVNAGALRRIVVRLRQELTLSVALIFFIVLTISQFLAEGTSVHATEALFIQDSYIALEAGLVLMVGVVCYVRTEGQIRQLLCVLTATTALVMVAQLLSHLFEVTLVGVTLVGSPINFAGYAGLAVLLGLSSIYVNVFRAYGRVIPYVAVSMGLYMLAISVTPIAVVLTLGFVALSALLYVAGSREQRPRVFVPIVFTMVVLVLVVMTPQSYFRNVSPLSSATELRPSATVTNEMIHAWYRDASSEAVLLFGSGPGNFSSAWNRHKPAAAHRSDIALIDFDNGFSSALTYAVTLGMLGILCFVLFVLSHIYESMYAIRTKRDARASDVSRVLLVISLYLWIWFFIYVPNPLLVALTFILTGLSIQVRGLEVDTQPPRI